MTELEKFKIAKALASEWSLTPDDRGFLEFIDTEIDRLQDPHAEAKRLIVLISFNDLTEYMIQRQQRKPIVNYVRHLENELVKAKAASEPLQVKTADGWREAAAEPLDPKRVLATAAKVCNGSMDFHNGTNQKLIAGTAERLVWLCGINAKPYEVTE